MKELSGNVLILQMGRPAAVTNVILAALIRRALNYDCIGEVYGCVGGLQNLLSGQLIDLAGQPQKSIANLIGTPGAALKVLPHDAVEMAKVSEILRKYDIRYLFAIGDSSVVGQCKNLDEAAKRIGYEVRVMLIPTSATNAMQLTDHCLGYGSMAKHLAVMAKSVVADLQSIQPNGAITILELRGCTNEWLISGPTLARLRRDSSEAPHLTILSKFDEGMFVKNTHQTVKDVGNCVIVVGDRLVNVKGENLASQRSAAEHVEFIARANFDVQIDKIALCDWEVTSCMTLSGTDVAEAELCSQKALELAVSVGASGKMVTLLRTDSSKYTSEVSCVDLANVSNNRKEFPDAWYSAETMSLDVPFFKYASPLIIGEVRCYYEGGVPSFSQMK
ncbi:MAG: 6-phosphofructokinase [Puniceicoccales bacterium]|jgi:6-phosphofructokinase 1|nr:6-phosphofructokinase [Puniceicoccales bacterium]